jgi:hypothetical protein
MKTTKDLLRHAQELIEAEPALLTMIETRADAERLHGILQKFVEKADDARFYKDRNYLELVSILGSSKPNSARLKAAIKRSGATTGKDKNKKVAVYAVKEGIAEELIRELKKGPQDIMKQNFLDLALLDVNEIEDAVAAMLTPKKAPAVAKAVGFDVAFKTKGNKAYDKKATVAHAMAKLKPYIDSMRNA